MIVALRPVLRRCAESPPSRASSPPRRSHVCCREIRGPVGASARSRSTLLLKAVCGASTARRSVLPHGAMSCRVVATAPLFCDGAWRCVPAPAFIASARRVSLPTKVGMMRLQRSYRRNDISSNRSALHAVPVRVHTLDHRLAPVGISTVH
jgi:hypothetical protein